MSAGFGFSVGDFITALSVVRDVIDAIQDSGTARVQYRQLLNQLYSLERALQQVNRLDFDDVDALNANDRSSEIAALRQAAAQCQRSIDEFFSRIRHYHPHLSNPGGNKNRFQWKAAWKKVQWTLCHKDDISKLQADLVGHTESINVLLASIQLKSTSLESQTQARRHDTLSRKLQDSYFICMRKLSAIYDNVSSGVQHSKRLVDMTTNVIEMNIRIFQMVLSIHHHVLRIPGQIERQQPVFLVDALGRSAPFHLEFVRSAKALTAVLEANFENIGVGADKVRKSEFTLEDVATGRDVDLETNWEYCFRPGQHVEMSMLFDRPMNQRGPCPRCAHGCQDIIDDQVNCSKCGLSFRRVISFEEPDLVPDLEGSSQALVGPKPATKRGSKRKHNHADDELLPFRKVRIRSWVPITLSEDLVRESKVLSSTGDDLQIASDLLRESMVSSNIEENLQNAADLGITEINSESEPELDRGIQRN